VKTIGGSQPPSQIGEHSGQGVEVGADDMRAQLGEQRFVRVWFEAQQLEDIGLAEIGPTHVALPVE